MPLVRGQFHLFSAPGNLGTEAILVITNDRWNEKMSQVGFLVVRRTVLPFEAPHAVGLPDGTSVIACAPLSLELAPSDGSPSAVGAAIGMIHPSALAAVEDALRDFLQLPTLLAPTPPRATKPPPGVITYPLWGDVFREVELTGGEHKRYVILSPSAFNAVAARVVAARTTTRFKYDDASFPTIQGGHARACCGEANTMSTSDLILGARDRPTPPMVSNADMAAIARGIAHTHELGASLRRIGITFP